MENNVAQSAKTANQAIIFTPQMLLDEWQGHRRLTRKAILAFPEDKLFSYSVGGMRPFAELVMEMIHIGAPGIRGVVTGKWKTFEEAAAEYKNPTTREELLKMWDEASEQISTLWAQIPPHRFLEEDKVFNQYDGPIYSSILYFIDNEIHHRAQGYVYLRSLGIEPPAFWDRF